MTVTTPDDGSPSRALTTWDAQETATLNNPVGVIGTLLSALLFACLFAYVLTHYRSWHGLAAFALAVLLAVLGSLAVVPHALASASSASPVARQKGGWQRAFMWGGGAVLAGLALSAALLGNASFSMSALIAIVMALAIPCFGEVLAVGAAADG
ncbi:MULTISPECIES: hypothetical protein [unclassified Streptomyces]|uniref:hypothetical protein n=1 Tax=unclassified Streptomyces TaxID=2593676 RepID=UPI00224E5F38|nr:MULTISPECIES: hypothetical protein [unclassified Streptomyces]MCX4554338.1 hypothetical protein [Streptomyces sp. NBC_01500]WSC25045.1 hypothetical protein OIE60_35975 [Streptomyces sp. NBC_01766]